MPDFKNWAMHYHGQLGFPDKGNAIKRSVVCMTSDCLIIGSHGVSRPPEFIQVTKYLATLSSCSCIQSLIPLYNQAAADSTMFKHLSATVAFISLQI